MSSIIDPIVGRVPCREDPLDENIHRELMVQEKAGVFTRLCDHSRSLFLSDLQEEALTLARLVWLMQEKTPDDWENAGVMAPAFSQPPDQVRLQQSLEMFLTMVSGMRPLDRDRLTSLLCLLRPGNKGFSVTFAVDSDGKMTVSSSEGRIAS